MICHFKENGLMYSISASNRSSTKRLDIIKRLLKRHWLMQQLQQTEWMDAVLKM